MPGGAGEWPLLNGTWEKAGTLNFGGTGADGFLNIHFIGAVLFINVSDSSGIGTKVLFRANVYLPAAGKI